MYIYTGVRQVKCPGVCCDTTELVVNIWIFFVKLLDKLIHDIHFKLQLYMYELYDYVEKDQYQIIDFDRCKQNFYHVTARTGSV